MDISVIIPAYNEEKYIEKTLKSVDYENAEVIVVCNGCTDRTENILRRHHKVKYFSIPQCGVSAARNFGAEMAKGRKLVFLDADIRLGKGLLKKIAAAKCDIGTCLVKSDRKKFLPRFLMFFKNFAHYFGACTGLIFCTNKMFNAVGGFDTNLNIGEDGKFLRQGRRLGKSCVVRGFVYNNMRRFEKVGYGKLCWFWIKHLCNPREKDYEAVR